MDKTQELLSITPQNFIELNEFIREYFYNFLYLDTPVVEHLKKVVDDSQELLKTTLEVNNPDSVFYKMWGLLQHDLDKVFVSCTNNCTRFILIHKSIEEAQASNNTELLEREQANLEETRGDLEIALKQLIGFLTILNRCEKSPNKNTSVSTEEFLETFDLSKENDELYLTTPRNPRTRETYKVKINIYFDQFDSFEEFISIRTLVLNAMGTNLYPMATSITIEKEISPDGNTIYRVRDNATNGIWGKNYPNDLKSAYDNGIENPDSRSPGNRYGGQLAVFAAGQRKTLKNSNEEFFSYSDKSAEDPYKSISIIF